MLPQKNEVLRDITAGQSTGTPTAAIMSPCDITSTDLLIVNSKRSPE
jgi:hypothetical protein